MNPRRIAHRFIREMTAFVFGDFLDLVAPGGEADHQFDRLEKAIRRRFGLAKHDIVGLQDAVAKAAPKRHRKAVLDAVSRLSEAETDNLSVRQNAAYLVGIEVGLRLRGHAPRKRDPQHGGASL